MCHVVIRGLSLEQGIGDMIKEGRQKDILTIEYCNRFASSDSARWQVKSSLHIRAQLAGSDNTAHVSRAAAGSGAGRGGL